MLGGFVASDGTLRVRPYPAGDHGTPDAAGQPQPGQPPGEATVADGKLVIGDLSLSADDVKSISAEKALRDSRRATMPATAADFTLDLPSDFVLPPGTSEFRFNLEDPVSAASLGQIKNFAFEHGLDQPALSKLLGVYAGHRIAEEARMNEAGMRELNKLGTNANARIDAVRTFLHATIGDELANALSNSMYTAKSIEGVEKLMRVFSNQGVTGNPGAGRDGGDGREPARLSNEEYDKLTFSQKVAYANQFDQRQFNRRSTSLSPCS